MAKKPLPKKNQREKPLKVDMSPDELLSLMGGSSPITQKQLQELKKAKEVGNKKKDS